MCFKKPKPEELGTISANPEYSIEDFKRSKKYTEESRFIVTPYVISRELCELLYNTGEDKKE